MRREVLVTDTTTQHFLCCGKQLDLSVPLQGDPDDRVSFIAAAARELGWVVSSVEMTSDGQPSVLLCCSAACHNRSKQTWWARRRPLHWWREIHGFGGQPPRCTCSLVADDEGLLAHRRDPDCPWDWWLDRWQEHHNRAERALFRRWEDVPIGTLVHERCRGRFRSRGAGRTTGPPKLVYWSFGGFCAAMVPVEDWGPHPRLSDLTVVPPDGKG